MTLRDIRKALEWQPLDTYEADFLNETPPRREQVTEIQCRDAGELLGYLNPARVEYVLRAVNALDAVEQLREVAREAMDAIENLQQPHIPKAARENRVFEVWFALCDALAALDAALAPGGDK